eukprot:SAG31_NODE_4461_length_3213_cov_3.575145_1_plen_63_part_10
MVNADCQSGQCYAGVCVSCDNGFVDGDESDIDCSLQYTHISTMLGMCMCLLCRFQCFRRRYQR